MISKKIFAESFIFSIIILLVIGQVALGQNGDEIQYKETAGLVEITTPELAVKVTASGRVPHFHFWNPKTDVTDYHVMFLRIFEAQDNNSDGAYNKDEDKMIGVPMALPVSNWDVSEFDNVQGESIHFNFTNLGDINIQICVHLYSANPEELKFDLIISGWDWQQEDSILVFQFTVSQSDHEQDPELGGPPENPSHQGTEVTFGEDGEAYMGYAEEAQAGNTPIPVRGSSNNGGEDGYAIYLAFENFGEETLVYDPTIGIRTVETDGEPNGEAETIGTPAIWIGLIGGISIGLVIIIRRIRTKY